MHTRYLGCLAALAAFSLTSGVAAAKCELQQLGVLPVDMQGPRPLVWAKINGAKARFLLDSGAFYSAISRDAAAQYQLQTTPIFGGSFHVVGTGGRARASRATIESFEFMGVPLTKVGFLVVDQNIWGAAAGSIGQNILRISDVEYDLANGIVRFIKPVGCGSQPLAYWAVSTPYSSIELQYMDVVQSQLRGNATINGQRISVLFDTGAPRSFLSLQAAQRAGITTSSPGVTYLGLAGGIGPSTAKIWLAPNVTFQIGGEKVEHAHLLIADLPTPPVGYVGDRPADMLLGADFFLSHRIYVAYSQKRLYFTYNGGPLFNLNLPQLTAGTAKPSGSPGAGSQTDATTAAQPASDTPTDADGFRRRGMARASMREFDQALEDLTRACELAPGDADNYYYRGLIYYADHELKPALQDFNTAISLRSDDTDARLARAELLLWHPDLDTGAAEAQVKSDLDAVSRLAPPDAQLRQTLADLYGRLGEYATALTELDQWGNHHSLPNDRVVRLNDRCWLLAAANRDLHEALDDCDRALAARPYAPAQTGTLIERPLAPEDPDVLDSRALVYIRLDNFKHAIRDYDSALNVNPRMATSLYGRGLAELRLGHTAQGQKDLTAAEKLDRGIAKRFAAMGLAP